MTRCGDLPRLPAPSPAASTYVDVLIVISKSFPPLCECAGGECRPLPQALRLGRSGELRRTWQVCVQ